MASTSGELASSLMGMSTYIRLRVPLGALVSLSASADATLFDLKDKWHPALASVNVPTSILASTCRAMLSGLCLVFIFFFPSPLAANSRSLPSVRTNACDCSVALSRSSSGSKGLGEVAAIEESGVMSHR